MASNYTENYGLCQWEATDQVLREEFNQDNDKIDKVLKIHSDILTALEERDITLETAIANVGNCWIVCGTYTGTGVFGETNPNILTFSTRPSVLIVQSRDPAQYSGQLIMIRNSNWGTNSANASVDYRPNITWGDKSVSWYMNGSSTIQLNDSGRAYCYVALLEI